MLSVALALLLSAPVAAQSAGAPFTLDRYIQESLSASPEVEQARQGLESARAHWLSEIGAAALPTLNFTATAYPYGDNPANFYKYNKWRLNRSDMSFNTTANWNLFNSFHDYQRVRSASLAKDSARWSYEAVRQARVLQAVQQFFDLALRDQLAEVTAQNLTAQREQYRVTKDLYDHGLKSLADLLKSETDVRSAELRVASSEADRKTALMAFNVSIDGPADRAVQLEQALELGTTELPRLDADVAQLAAKRPELLRAQAEAERARVAAQQSIEDNLLPTLALNATWNRQDAASFGLPASSFGIPNPNYQVGLALTIPVNFNLFSQAENVVAARADRRRAAAALTDRARGVRTEVYSAYIQLERSYLTHGVATAKEDIARRSLELVNRQYQQGSADAIRLAQAQLDYLDARIQRSQALHDAFINRSQYRLAVGESLWR